MNAWLTCAPGDPTGAQWRAIREMANGRDYCATRWNERSHYVMVEIADDRYSVSPDGHDARYLGSVA